MINTEIIAKERKESFTKNLKRLSKNGFNKTQSFSILNRIKKHIYFCIENKQDYEETLFYVSQDFSFSKDLMEDILMDAILSEEETELYFS